MSKTSDSTFTIDGIEVQFPYEPYSCQKSYMESVIKAVKDGKNALLESPTGTGKTLSLICSTLACILADRKNRLKLEVNKDDSQSSSLEETVMDKINSLRGSLETDKKAKITNPNKVNIIYTSRTHSQLKQVINEVKKSHYSTEFHSKGLKPVLLASRDLLCVNPARGALSGENLNNFCRLAVKNRECSYFNSMRGSKGSDEFQLNELMDIEDMVKVGKKSSFCPYFAVKEAQDTADLILVPYNYLLSATVREAMDLRIKNSVVIIDEAHNVESVAEEASSFFIKQIDIAKYIDALKRLASFHKEFLMAGKQESVEELDISTLLKLAICLKNTDDFLSSISLMDPRQVRGDEPKRDQIGTRWCVKEISRHHVVYSAYSILSHIYNKLEYSKLKGTRVEETLSHVVLFLTKGVMDGDVMDETFIRHYDDKTLKEDIMIFVLLKKFVSLILSRDLTDFPEFYNVMITNDEKYETAKRLKTSDSRSHGWNKKFRGREPENEEDEKYYNYNYDVIPKVLSFECLQPIPTFVRIKREGVRSVILTSGTLGPLAVLEKHIGGGHVNFEIKLQNNHVIDPSRVWAAIVSGNSEDPKILSSAYNNRKNLNYLTALGKSLLSFLKCVPSGVLVFFGSYEVMNDTLSNWKRLGLYSKIEMVKSVFVELRRNEKQRDTGMIPESTLQLFARYKKTIDEGRGAVFFAICRGQMAEGIDFSDNYCRGIFLCGIPYPSRYEDGTALKMDYLNRLPTQPDQRNSLSDEWYTTQAIRAINQAIGRSIRHIDDYGAILLADYRFNSPYVKPSISKWVLKLLKNYTTIDQCTDDLTSFFKRNKNNKSLSSSPVLRPANHSPVSIKIDPSLEFKSRDSNKNLKTSTQRFYKFFSESSKLQRDYESPISSYFSKIQRASNPSSPALKVNRPLTFKTFENWSFSQGDDSTPK